MFLWSSWLLGQMFQPGSSFGQEVRSLSRSSLFIAACSGLFRLTRFVQNPEQVRVKLRDCSEPVLRDKAGTEPLAEVSAALQVFAW